MESTREFTSKNAIQQAPTYLVMVTAKIAVTINGSKPIEMLLDSRSELNIITQELQEGLGLPMDPSGANWSIRTPCPFSGSLSKCSCRRQQNGIQSSLLRYPR